MPIRINHHIMAFERALNQHRREEERIRISEIRYRRLFEAARDGILILDPASRKIIDANPFMCELLGYLREEFVGKELWEIGLHKDEQASREAFEALERDGYKRYENLPLRTKSGVLREVEFVSNMYREADDLVIQCNIRDITARKQSESAPREPQKLLDALSKALDAPALLKMPLTVLFW
jgi:PAS domain S-box-containing protein